jgi:hypothetical protein
MRSNKRIGVSDDSFNTFFSGTKTGESVPHGLFMDIGRTANCSIRRRSTPGRKMW